MNEKKRTAKVLTTKTICGIRASRAQKTDNVLSFEEDIPLKTYKKSIYEPIREQFLLLLEYLNILDDKRQADPKRDVGNLIEFMDIMRRKCEVYLNYQLLKSGK